jgi:hypothetical protein
LQGSGFDFSRFDHLVEEHKQTVKEREIYQERRKNSEKSEKREEENSRLSWGLGQFIFQGISFPNMYLLSMFVRVLWNFRA